MKESSEKGVAYPVVLAETARGDANQIYDWVVEQAPITGPEWFEELVDCLYSLEQLPYRAHWLAKRLKLGVRSDAVSLASGSTLIASSTKSTKTAKRSGSYTSGAERFETSLPNN